MGFAAGFDRKLDEAAKAIETMGRFVQECGSPEKAKAAIEAYQAVAAAANGKQTIVCTKKATGAT